MNISNKLTKNKLKICKSFINGFPNMIDSKHLHLYSCLFAKQITTINSYRLVIALNLTKLQTIVVMKEYDFFSLTTKNHIKNIKEFLSMNSIKYEEKEYDFFYSEIEEFYSKIEGF